MRICILGWGSLLWDQDPVFDARHGAWQADGPKLKLEFSRVSEKRLRALTVSAPVVWTLDCMIRQPV